MGMAGVAIALVAHGCLQIAVSRQQKKLEGGQQYADALVAELARHAVDNG